MKRLFLILMLCVVAAGLAELNAVEIKTNDGGIYVPLTEIGRLVDPGDKAVLMEKAEFDKLLAQAKAVSGTDDGIKLAEILDGSYQVKVAGDKAVVTGTLKVISTCQKPVFVELGFGGLGLDSVLFEGTAAPLGYNDKGQLGLIVTGKGSYSLQVSGATRLRELASGGMQFGLRVPEAVSGRMKLTAGGDVEVHASVPATKGEYSSKDDKTTSELTIGGLKDITVVLAGNDSREQESSILLGRRATTVTLSKTQEVVSSLYTVQVLRRSVKELSFRVPINWTITEVTCPGLVKWSVMPLRSNVDSKTMTLRFSSAKKGKIVLHVKATAARGGEVWNAGGLKLDNADFERGYLMVITDEELGVRGESISGARREDVAVASYITGMANAAGGRLYFMWGSDWNIQLALAEVKLRRSIDEKQRIIVDRSGVKLVAEFDVTAVDREMFMMRFNIAGQSTKWKLANVTVNGRKDGFQWRVEKDGKTRQLSIELPDGVDAEKLARVAIVMDHVPGDWDWSGEAIERGLSIPVVTSQADTVSGLVTVSTAGDLCRNIVGVLAGLNDIIRAYRDRRIDFK